MRDGWTGSERRVNTRWAAVDVVHHRGPAVRMHGRADPGVETMADNLEHPEHHPESDVRKSFDEHLTELKADVIRMAAMVGESIGAGTQALLDADLGVVEQVLANDDQIDALEHDLELRAYELIATQQPMAVDLRTLLAVLRILHELELTGDLMVTVAKAARRIYPTQLPPRIRGLIERMGDQASKQWQLAVDAFADDDQSLAAALPDMDDVMDDLQKQLFRAIFETLTPDEAGLQMAVQLALIGRYYERVADHAVGIGVWTQFVVTGELPGREPGPTEGTAA
ncbi:MAG: phosphate signaling complex protein PhoU [Actinomycetota bacterium]